MNIPPLSLARYDVPMRIPALRAESRAAGMVRGHGAGKAACLHLFARVRTLSPAFWLSLPLCIDDPDHRLARMLGRASAGAVPYAAIATETERSLSRGVRSTGPLALMLLAALALQEDGCADAALQLGQVALDLAGQHGDAHLHCVRTLHAALVAPLAGTLGHAPAELAAICDGNGPLPHAFGGSADIPHPGRFGYWLTRLQAAWYAGNHTLALHAIDHAAALAGPLLPVVDRLTYHLFAALALSQCGEAAAIAKLEPHCAALRRLADRFPGSNGAFAMLASAARDRLAGAALGALRGFDSAGTAASLQGQHWIAALAWEQAALQADDCRLESAVQHYRRQALASYQRWGTLGRVDRLRRAWGETGADATGEQQAGRERSLRAGCFGELGLSIAHEVNQPLAAISLHAAAAGKWLRRATPDIDKALASIALISAAGRQAGDIVRSVQRLALRQENEMGSVPVDQTISDALQLLQRPLRKHAIAVELALGLGECIIHANRVQLQQVVTNLLVNAIEALAGDEAGGAARRIRVQTRHYNAHEVEIAVADNGPGIALHHQDRVFGSMFSTKPDSTGMGLSISLAIVRAHGGHIAYEPAEPHGACFRFRLPVQPAPDSPGAAARQAG